MRCVKMRDAWKSAELTALGKNKITFNRARAIDPTDSFLVPCGRCIGCRADESLMWGLRCYHEFQSCGEVGTFATLTFAKEPSDRTVRPLQLFLKRLRHETPFRYFAVGEDGDMHGRWHYHVLFFGQDFRGDAYSIGETSYGSETLNRTWDQGYVYCDDLTLDSCLYTTGYCLKKLGDAHTVRTMSRRPGIGHSFTDRYADDLRRTGVCVVNGQEYRIPKQYFNWAPAALESVKAANKEWVANQTPEQLKRKRDSERSRYLNIQAQLRLKGRVSIFNEESLP